MDNEFPLSDPNPIHRNTLRCKGKPVIRNLPHGQLNSAGRLWGGRPHHQLTKKVRAAMLMAIASHLNRTMDARTIARRWGISRQYVYYISGMLRKEGANIPRYPSGIARKLWNVKRSRTKRIVRMFKNAHPQLFDHWSGTTIDFGDGNYALLSGEESKPIRKMCGIPDIPELTRHETPPEDVGKKPRGKVKNPTVSNL